MQIITQNLIKHIKNNNIFSNEFLYHIQKLVHNMVFEALSVGKLNLESIFTEIHSEIFHSVNNLIKYMITSMDLKFFNSKERKANYMSKGKHSRTILFLFGEITIERYYYVNKHTNKDGFFFIDKYFNLPKKYLLSDDAKNQLFYLVSELGSYSLAGKKLGEFINKFSRLYFPYRSISRATVYNYVKNADFNYSFKINHRKVDNIYIELDEHYVATQNFNIKDGKSKKIMVKAAKIYSGKYKNSYSDRFIIIDNFKTNFKDLIFEYVCSEYDLDYVNNIYILGDGANWIKSCVDLFDRNKCTFILDKFHAFQAVNRMVTSKNKNAYEFVSSFIFNNDLKTFKIWYELFVSENKDRLNTIESNYNYIVNHWSAIQRSLNTDAPCSMEGCISSTLADGLTSRPKGFSLKTLSNRLTLRAFYRNSFKDEDKFYEFLKVSTSSKNNNDNLNFSILDYHYKSDTYKLNLNYKNL